MIVQLAGEMYNLGDILQFYNITDMHADVIDLVFYVVPDIKLILVVFLYGASRSTQSLVQHTTLRTNIKQ